MHKKMSGRPSYLGLNLLEATIDYHEYSMYCGHYTTSVNCCWKIIAISTELLEATSVICEIN